MKKLILSIALLISIGSNAQKNSLSLGFYNLENLFDTINDPATKDEDFTPNGSLKWNNEKYNKKLQKQAAVIACLVDGKSPDFIGFCEVENRIAISALLAQKALKKSKYQLVHYDSPDERGIDVAFAYKKSAMKLISSRVIPVLLNNDKTRDILMLSGVVQKSGDTAFFFVCHFPSRTGGKDETAEKRVAAAMALAAVTDSIQRVRPNAPIMIVGDFNDEPQDFSLQITLRAAEKIETLPGNGLLNLMAPLKAAGQGSYVYRKENEMIDQVIVSKAMLTDSCRLQYIQGSARVFNPEWLQDKGEYQGSPLRTYAGRKYLGGYSDHFPVYVKFSVSKKKKK